MNIFDFVIVHICLQNNWIIHIEKKQIDANYEVVVLLATLNNKTTNKISVNFKFYNTPTKSELKFI